MKVGVVFSEVPSCEHYRARGPAEVLAERGEIEYEWLTDGVRVRFGMRRTYAPEPVGLVDPPDVDVCVFVRGVFPQRIHEVIRMLQRRGIAVVIDFDDAYDRLPSQLQGIYKISPTQNVGYNWRNAISAARLGDAVTVSTPALCRYRPDAVVLPNYISQSYVDTGRQTKRDGKTVGWTGTVYGHPGDLRQCGAGVAEAVRRTGARFLNVGDGVDVKRDLNLDEDPVVTGIVGFDRFPSQLARIDVGIAPLVLDSYRREAKSWLKPLETLAVGGQYVASPSVEYLKLQHDLERWAAMAGLSPEEVPGVVVNNRGREWRRGLLRFLEAPEKLRRARCAAARSFVEQEKLMENHAFRWAEVWEQAVKNRRRMGRRVAA